MILPYRFLCIFQTLEQIHLRVNQAKQTVLPAMSLPESCATSGHTAPLPHWQRGIFHSLILLPSALSCEHGKQKPGDSTEKLQHLAVLVIPMGSHCIGFDIFMATKNSQTIIIKKKKNPQKQQPFFYDSFLNVSKTFKDDICLLKGMFLVLKTLWFVTVPVTSL